MKFKIKYPLKLRHLKYMQVQNQRVRFFFSKAKKNEILICPDKAYDMMSFIKNNQLCNSIMLEKSPFKRSTGHHYKLFLVVLQISKILTSIK
jgi:hypothetical protein